MSYITKTNLTLGPQLGSQMGQYAGLYSVSKRLGLEIILLKEFINSGMGIKLLDTFNLSPKILSLNDVSELNFNRYELKEQIIDNEVFLIDSSTNWDISGWFHLYHYFDRFREDILDLYTFKNDIVSVSKSNLDKIRNSEDIPLVSIHFRRGDYLQVSSLNLDNYYYNQALKIIHNTLKNFKLIVFSDDIEWCKQNMEGENVFYSENNSNYVDMCMMSMCDHNIIANSSFSWWGAYLNRNKNKLVICPEDYAGEKSSHIFINKNYYPRDWVSLKIK